MLESTSNIKLVLDWLYKAATEHEAVIGLVALAFIIAMPPALPGWIGRVETLQWGWKWMRDGLINLVSLQHPKPQQSTVTETQTRSVSVETTPREQPVAAQAAALKTEEATVEPKA